MATVETGPNETHHIAIGTCIGGIGRPTATCTTLQEDREHDGIVQTCYFVKHIERTDPGWSFTQRAERIAEIARRANHLAKHYWSPTLYIDWTGLGEPVLDQVRDTQMPVNPVGVQINGTGVNKKVETEEYEDVRYEIGKIWLVSRLVLLFEEGRIFFPKGKPEFEPLVRALTNFHLNSKTQGPDPEVPFSVGKNDDLVTALGLTVQPRPFYDEPMVF